MKVNSQIDEIIAYLQKKKKEGYKTVELIDDAAADGWSLENPSLNFIYCKSCPTVVGIDARTKNKRKG